MSSLPTAFEVDLSRVEERIIGDSTERFSIPGPRSTRNYLTKIAADEYLLVGEVVDALVQMAEAEEGLVRNQIFNVAAPDGNYSKHQVVELAHKRVPQAEVEYRDLSFGGDMRDVAVSCAKIERVLGFRAQRSVEQGILEVKEALENGLIEDPFSPRYRNHQCIVN